MVDSIRHRQKVTKRRFCKDVACNTLNTLHEFGLSTTLHGLKKIIDDFNSINKLSIRKTLSKRESYIAKFVVTIIWGGSFLVGIALLVILNVLFWQRKEAASTITTIDTYYHPIYAVPFPAITLCNINVVHRPSLQWLIDKLVNLGFNESEIIETASDYRALVKLNHEQWPISNRTIAHDILLTDNKVDTLMLKLMQPCSAMMKKCFWFDRSMPCEQLFFVSKSSEGYCCSFNYEHIMQLDESKLNPEFRSSGAYGLDLLLSPDTNHYVSHKKPFDGIDISIHGRADFSDTEYFLSLSPGYQVDILLTPSVLVTDKEVRSLIPSKRNCLFEDERALLMTNKYSYSSCMADCHVKAYMKHCSCIPFYYPHIELPQFNKTCDFRHVKCMNGIRNIISSIDPPTDHDIFLYSKNDNYVSQNCRCMPGCHEVGYHPRVSLGNTHVSPDANSNVPITKFNISANEMKKHTILTVAFEDSTCIKYRRSIYMTWEDLLGSLGGVFGLCLGGSFISLIEIVHFFLTRTIGRALLRYTQRKHIKPNTKRVYFITSQRHFQTPFIN